MRATKRRSANEQRNQTKPRMIQVILMRFDAAAEIFHYPLRFFLYSLYSSVKHYKLHNYAHRTDMEKTNASTHTLEKNVHLHKHMGFSQRKRA